MGKESYKVNQFENRERKVTDDSIAIAAYSASLKLTFIAGMVSFLIVLFLVLPIELPKLERQKDLPKDDEEV
jgi:hypothetical protein